jgi:hypothetical protein
MEEANGGGSREYKRCLIKHFGDLSLTFLLQDKMLGEDEDLPARLADAMGALGLDGTDLSGWTFAHLACVVEGEMGTADQDDQASLSECEDALIRPFVAFIDSIDDYWAHEREEHKKPAAADKDADEPNTHTPMHRPRRKESLDKEELNGLLLGLEGAPKDIGCYFGLFAVTVREYYEALEEIDPGAAQRARGPNKTATVNDPLPSLEEYDPLKQAACIIHDGLDRRRLHPPVTPLQAPDPEAATKARLLFRRLFLGPYALIYRNEHMTTGTTSINGFC